MSEQFYSCASVFQDLQRRHRWVGIWLQSWGPAKPRVEQRVRSINTIFSATITIYMIRKYLAEAHLWFACEQVWEGPWPPLILHLKWFPDHLHSSSWGVWSRRPGKDWSSSCSRAVTQIFTCRCLLQIPCFYNVIYGLLPVTGAIKEQHEVSFRHEGP